MRNAMENETETNERGSAIKDHLLKELTFELILRWWIRNWGGGMPGQEKHVCLVLEVELTSTFQRMRQDFLWSLFFFRLIWISFRPQAQTNLHGWIKWPNELCPTRVGIKNVKCPLRFCLFLLPCRTPSVCETFPALTLKRKHRSFKWEGRRTGDAVARNIPDH